MNPRRADDVLPVQVPDVDLKVITRLKGGFCLIALVTRFRKRGDVLGPFHPHRKAIDRSADSRVQGLRRSAMGGAQEETRCAKLERERQHRDELGRALEPALAFEEEIRGDT